MCIYIYIYFVFVVCKVDRFCIYLYESLDIYMDFVCIDMEFVYSCVDLYSEYLEYCYGFSSYLFGLCTYLHGLCIYICMVLTYLYDFYYLSHFKTLKSKTCKFRP